MAGGGEEEEEEYEKARVRSAPFGSDKHLIHNCYLRDDHLKCDNTLQDIEMPPALKQMGAFFRRK